MSFLAPLFLFGALTIALPVIFHFIRRSVRERVPFSSLMFLTPSPPRLTRRSRLEDLLLLLLRCLVVLLIASAFARPYLRRALPFPDQSGTGRRILLLIDTSASMRRPDVWREVAARAGQLLDSWRPLDEIALGTFDHSFKPVTPFEELANLSPDQRRAAVRQHLQNIAPGWNDTQLGASLMAAARWLDEPATGTANAPNREKQIVLISDLQEGSHLEALQGFEWPRGFTVRVEPVGKRNAANAGLQWVVDPDDLGRVNEKFSPRVRITNSRDAGRERFRVGWARGDRDFEGPALDVYVPPGQSRTVALPAARTNGPSSALLTGDEVDFDNRAFIAPPETRETKVLFIGPDADQEPSQPYYYLRRAFLDTGRQKVALSKLSPGSPALFQRSNDWKLVIVDAPLSEEWTAGLRAFGESGRTLLIVISSPAMGETLRHLLGLATLPVTDRANEEYAMLKEIDFQHPLFAPLADPKYRDFTKIHFWKHRALDPALLKDSRVLARFDDDDPALIEAALGKGRLLILTSGWQPADSQFALSSKFIPFCYALLHAGPDAALNSPQYFVGDVIPLPKGPGMIRRPDGSEVSVGLEENFTQSDLPGIYRWSGPAGQSQFAVNLKASESQTAPLSALDLERMGVPLPAGAPRKLAGTELKTDRQAASLEQKQKLWRWLLLAALVVLFLETYVASWLTRRRLALL